MKARGLTGSLLAKSLGALIFVRNLAQVYIDRRYPDGKVQGIFDEYRRKIKDDLSGTDRLQPLCALSGWALRVMKNDASEASRIDVHADLVEAFPPLGNLKPPDFTRDQVLGLADSVAGDKVLKSVVRHHKALADCGIATRHLVLLSGSQGGADAIEALGNNIRDFSPANISALTGMLNRSVSHDIARAIADIAVNDESLEGHGIGFAYLAEMIASDRVYSPVAVSALASGLRELIDAGFDPEQLKQVGAKRPRGAETLTLLIEQYPNLLDAGFKPSELTDRLQLAGARPALIALTEHRAALRNYGFTADLLTDMIGHNGIGPAIEAIVRNIDALRTHGVTPQTLATLSKQSRASHKIDLAAQGQ
jgi:hypothetical protein